MKRNNEIVIVAAVAENNVIGNEGSMPWGRLKEDMKHFRNMTMGHPVIMGRKTFESILSSYGKPLDGRTNIVLTSRRGFQHDDVAVFNTLETALDHARSLSETSFVIGGQAIYEQTIQLADRLEITKIKERYGGDKYFPEIDMNVWRLSAVESTDKNYDFLSYRRRDKDE